jgi:ATP-dependent Clp protease adaptor protein ClpS
MKLFILDDEVNTFEHVIDVIQRCLSYPYTQALSIANIIHYSGKCLVKDSEDKVILYLYKNMKKEGLNLKIEV